VVIWLTGLGSAGKSTIAQGLAEALRDFGQPVEILDGDVVRQTLCRDLGFSKTDRDENIKRIGFVAELLSRNGIIVIVAAISPYRAARDEVRHCIPDFIEVYVNAPIEICERRDRKGLYKRARAGHVTQLTGISDPYEAPPHPEAECRTDIETVNESVQKVLRLVELRRSVESAGARAFPEESINTFIPFGQPLI
jgi:adenylylsulfate kinase